jgi:hypothetical protein
VSKDENMREREREGERERERERERKRERERGREREREREREKERKRERTRERERQRESINRSRERERERPAFHSSVYRSAPKFLAAISSQLQFEAELLSQPWQRLYRSRRHSRQKERPTSLPLQLRGSTAQALHHLHQSLQKDLYLLLLLHCPSQRDSNHLLQQQQQQQSLLLHLFSPSLSLL